MTAPLWLVAYPVLGEVGGLLLEEDGTVVAGPEQRERPSDLVAALGAKAPPNRDVNVAPGWDKAPEGLREAYRARQGARGPKLIRRIEDEEDAR